MPSNTKEYQRNYMKQHYHNNKEYYAKKRLEGNNKRRAYLNRFVSRYKMWRGCADCGYAQHPQALHFDHLHSKLKDVSQLVAEARSLNAVKTEIRKCEIRCANCHALKTYNRRTQG